jgi:predicted dehydrogenase
MRHTNNRRPEELLMSLRIGIAGLGRGAGFVEHFKQIDGCEVVAVCDANPVALERFPDLETYSDYSAMIAQANLDVACIITPGPAHAGQAIEALQAGCHVLSETPCIYSLAEAQAVAAAAKAAQRKYMLAEDYIFMGWIEVFEDIIASGRLGEIIGAEAEYTHDCRGGMLLDSDNRPHHTRDWGTRNDLRPAWRASDLPPLYYCSHTLGPILHLLQDRCTLAVGLNSGGKAAPEVCPTDLEHGILRTEQGRIIRLTNGFCLAHPFWYTLGIYGTAGSLRLTSDTYTQVRLVGYFDDDAAAGFQEIPCPWFDRKDGRKWMLVMLGGFIQAILEDREPPLDMGRSFELNLPGVMAHQSAEQGGMPLAIPDLR